jgi:hypothetical protein
VHRHRLARTGTPPATSESGDVVSLIRWPPKIGEACGVAPHVDVDRESDPLPGQRDRRGVRVDHLLSVQVDHEHGGGCVVQHLRQPRRVGGGCSDGTGTQHRFTLMLGRPARAHMIAESAHRAAAKARFVAPVTDSLPQQPSRPSRR